MKILCYEEVVRYYVEFDSADVSKLRACGQLPSHCSIPAYLWLTLEELEATLKLIGFPRDRLVLTSVPPAGEYKITNR